MTDRRENLEAFDSGVLDDEERGSTDFADEHETTTVDPHILSNEGDGRGEEESPRGWDGMDH